MTGSPAMLTSHANPRVKAAVRLRDRHEREATGFTIVDGAREIDRALDAGMEVVEAFACEEMAAGREAQRVLDRLRGGEPSVRRAGGQAALTWVSRSILEKLAFGDRNDGVVAVVRAPRTGLADLRLPGTPLVAVLEGVEKPGNLGAVLRSADGAGVDAVIAADARTDLYNPNAIRASLGTIFTVPVVTATSTATADWLRAHGLRIVVARVDATTFHTDADLTGPLAIVLGSEAGGLTTAWETPDVIPVRLPMLGAADSLNVSVAAAILFYEALRQRSGRRPE
jgi:TrmH family RNA methyltransferase